MTANLSALYGRSVLDVSSATTVGNVRCGLVDAEDGTVEALVLDKTPGDGSILSWSSIKSIGPDAITVESADVFRVPGDGEKRAAKGDLDPIGKRVLTDGGEEIGELSDLTVDEDSGTVEGVTVGDHHLPGTSIIGSGDYAVVVKQSDVDA